MTYVNTGNDIYNRSTLQLLNTKETDFVLLTTGLSKRSSCLGRMVARYTCQDAYACIQHNNTTELVSLLLLQQMHHGTHVLCVCFIMENHCPFCCVGGLVLLQRYWLYVMFYKERYTIYE